jgi:tetratricopeptide (TPR) repeat protein
MPGRAANEWEIARQRYDAKDYRGAAVIYEKLLTEKGPSAEVYYNLGNTYYRMNEPGRAAVAFERALLMKPGHVEATSNLEHLRAKEGSATLQPNWSARILNAVEGNTAVIIATCLGWIAVIAILAGCFLARRRASLFLCGTFFAVLAVAYPVLRYTSTGYLYDQSRAVVIHTGAAARFAPALGGSVVRVLPPGSVVKILLSRGTWTYVAVGGKDRGWIQSASIERLLSGKEEQKAG